MFAYILRNINMTKRKKKAKQSNRLKTILLIIIVSIASIIVYEQFRSPILHAAIRAKNVTEVIIETDKEEISGDLERPIFKISRPEQVIIHAGYSVSFNPKWKLPNWVSYELTEDETLGNLKRTDKFIIDPDVKTQCATNRDYSKSGYDRGHMAPAADMKWNTSVMKECFYFSNMCPQKHSLNAGKWKTLEEKVRDWAKKDSAIIVICGPIVKNGYQTIGENRIVVPQHFFKVILSPYKNGTKAIGFIMRNCKETQPLSNYSVTIDSIEQLTGIDFFSALPDDLENKVESNNSISEWGL